MLKNVSLVRANYKNRTAHGKNKKGCVCKAPRSGLYSGTCSKMIFSYMSSLLVYLCVLMIIKYTPMIMMYRRPSKLSGDKQRRSHSSTRRNYCKPILKKYQETPWVCMTREFDGHEVKSSDYLRILSVSLTSHRKQTDI